MKGEENQVTQGVIAFLDILGIKGIWSRMEVSPVIIRWDKIVNSFNKYAGIANEIRFADYCKIQAFSDTIIITMDISKLTTEERKPYEMIIKMADILIKPFVDALLEGVYIRGVISIGEFYQSETLLIGPAVDEAAEWYEYSDWIGVSTTPSASYGMSFLKNRKFLKRFLNDTEPDLSNFLIEYEIPMKNGKKEMGWALAWPYKIHETYDTKEKISPIDRIYKVFSSNPIGIAASPKYTNTLAFFDYYKSKYQTNT